MWQGQHSRTIVVGVAFAIFVVCCVFPVGYLFATTLGATTGAYAAVVLDERQRGLLLTTTLLGAGTALLATTIGAPLGVVLARVPLRRKTVVRLLLGAPIFLPSYVVALAWIYLGWTNSLPASIVVLSLVLYPLSMLVTEGAMRRVDGRLEEAGLVVASPGRVLWRITLPLVAPGIVAAALIIFVLAVSDFGVPGLLRVRVYTTEVFTAFAALYDFGLAIVLAVPLLVLCAIVAAAAALLLGDRLVATRRPVGISPVTFDDWRRPAALAVFLIVAVAVALPLAILARETFQAGSLVAAMADSRDAIANSLMLAGVGATLVVAVAVWLGYAEARARRASRLCAQIVFVVLFALPSTIVGVGLIGLWNRPGLLGAFYGTDAMFLIAYLARFLPVAALFLAATTRAVPISHEDAAAVSGAGWLRTFTRIVVPQLRPGIAAAWIVAFVLSFGELGVSILIAPPGEATLPIRIYTLIANTSSSNIAMLALLQSLVILFPAAALAAVASRSEAR